MSAADEPMTSVEELVELSRHPKFVALGETGLDYHYTAERAGVHHVNVYARRGRGDYALVINVRRR